jgi:D-inositol-3-phosphate glycosyltransferase
VPVVASAVGGLQYSVSDGVTGYLVPPHDPAALARSLAHLHANPRLAQAMGRAGMHRVRSLFTWERVASMLQDAYADVLRAHRAPATQPLSQPAETPATSPSLAPAEGRHAVALN